MATDKEKQAKEELKRITSEMKADERYISYFAPFEENSVNKFIEKYAEARTSLVVYGNFTKHRQESVIDDYHTGSWNALNEIQFKKLFDLECLWRAGQLTHLRDVQVTMDFSRISKNILLYDGIPQVSRADIELYQQYLRQEPRQIVYSLNYSYYPDYEDVKNCPDNADTNNEYLNFHNSLTGNNGLLLLPDVRGLKELKYLDAARDFNFSNTKTKNANNPAQRITKKYLPRSDEELIRFGNHFGDKKAVNFIIDRLNWIKEKPDLIFTWAFEYLRDIAPEMVPIEAHEDWKKGMYFAAIKHRNEKISCLLPVVYEEYLLKKEMCMLEASNTDQHSAISEIYKNGILQGRELLGEPRDFNF
ncbi:MAG: hypothetical protein HC819_17825 [Cyclobacteriaceae bacterium]|nr:hypothetical protein [Cyclobacteriaceae bacterium]